MISAYDAHLISIKNDTGLIGSPECKFALDKLENEIKSMSAKGEIDICQSVAFLTKDGSWLGLPYYTAIKEHMEKHGYVFYFKNVLNDQGNYVYSFVCQWGW